MNNKEAGVAIGRKGATVSSLQSKSNASVKVSHAGEYFPGSEFRIVVIRGQIQNVQSAFELLFTELFSDSDSWKSQSAALGSEEEPTLLVTLAVPDITAGLLIGKGGEHIRHMVEVTGAKIHVLPKDRVMPGVNERLVTIQGTLQHIIKAGHLILDKMGSDPKSVFQNPTSQYKDVGPPFGREMFSDVGPPPGMRFPPPEFGGGPGFGGPVGFGGGGPGPMFGGPGGGFMEAPFRDMPPPHFRDVGGPPPFRDGPSSFRDGPSSFRDVPPSRGRDVGMPGGGPGGMPSASASFTLHVPGGQPSSSSSSLFVASDAGGRSRTDHFGLCQVTAVWY